jgi:hypothetical protein
MESGVLRRIFSCASDGACGRNRFYATRLGVENAESTIPRVAAQGPQPGAVFRCPVGAWRLTPKGLRNRARGWSEATTPGNDRNKIDQPQRGLRPMTETTGSIGRDSGASRHAREDPPSPRLVVVRLPPSQSLPPPQGLRRDESARHDGGQAPSAPGRVVTAEDPPSPRPVVVRL